MDRKPFAGRRTGSGVSGHSSTCTGTTKSGRFRAQVGLDRGPHLELRQVEDGEANPLHQSGRQLRVNVPAAAPPRRSRTGRRAPAFFQAGTPCIAIARSSSHPHRKDRRTTTGLTSDRPRQAPLKIYGIQTAQNLQWSSVCPRKSSICVRILDDLPSHLRGLRAHHRRLVPIQRDLAARCERGGDDGLHGAIELRC